MDRARRPRALVPRPRALSQNRVSGAPYGWDVEPTRPDGGAGRTGDPEASVARIGEALERIEADLHLLIEVARDQQRLLDLIARKLS